MPIADDDVRRPIGHDLERPACFIRSNRRRCGQAPPTFASGSSLRRSRCMEIARRSRPLTAAPNTRIDLLFTMSDITPAPDRSPAWRIDKFSRTSFDLWLDLQLRLAVPPGGARRDRTDDLLLAKQALSQLSYGPFRDRISAIGNQRMLASSRPITEFCPLISGDGGPGKI